MVWQAIAGGAAGGAAGGLMGMGTGALSQHMQFNANRKMYRHRYRWAKADLEQAGFNPLLAVGGGMAGPASVSAPNMSPHNIDFMGAGLKGAQTKTQKSEQGLKDQQKATAEALESAHRANARYQDNQSLLSQAQRGLVNAQTAGTAIRAQLDANQLPRTNVEAEIWRGAAGEPLAWYKMLLGGPAGHSLLRNQNRRTPKSRPRQPGRIGEGANPRYQNRPQIPNYPNYQRNR